MDSSLKTYLEEVLEKMFSEDPKLYEEILEGIGLKSDEESVRVFISGMVLWDFMGFCKKFLGRESTEKEQDELIENFVQVLRKRISESGIESSENYFIRGPEGNNGSVELWSAKRLPFEPEDWLLEMRNSLRTAVENMNCSSEEVLHAVYSSKERDFVDAENVLFYNVGTSAFKNLCKKGLVFERMFKKPPRIQESTGGEHHQKYSTAEKEVQSSNWGKTELLAHWNGVKIPPLSSSAKPHVYWHAVKQGSVQSSGGIDPNHFYGIDLKIKAPAGTEINLASAVKPLLDGIISSFHAHDGPELEKVAERLSNYLSEDVASIKDLLKDEKSAVLGIKNLVRPFGEGVQWHPDDDICVYAKILFDDCLEDDSWSVTGEIFTVSKIS